MKKELINYETLIKITGAISATRDPEEVVLLTVQSVKTALGVAGRYKAVVIEDDVQSLKEPFTPYMVNL